ncbi:hypothetical protein [Nitrosophilus kaiyonis]|uniref:hypothetical protein n=1 Tax=Nitrosophilus kaiyonis TaxID=2930200 RepID=UPI002492D6F0|nr:hypothetical protein [Nitrosophilus kaiyonis]
MNLYFYAKTGHRIGLDRLRRTVALMKEFDEYNPLLMVQDFRAASYAKSDLGVKRSVGIDDVRNMANICQRGDIIIFDSDEYNDLMHQDMIDFFGKFIRISDNPKDKPKKGEILISPYLKGENIINSILVDKKYFGDFEKNIDKTFFFGDDDYEKDLLKVSNIFEDLNMNLLEGFYFFINYSDELKKYYKNIFEIEDYEEVIKKTKLFISSSAQSSLEAIASGADVIYIQREDKDSNLIPLFSSLGVKVIEKFDKNLVKNAIETEFILNKNILYEKNVTITATNLKNNLFL